MSRRWGVQIVVALLAVLVAALAAADRASAARQLQWQVDLSGETGGSLVLVCDDPSAPTGDAGQGGDDGGAGGSGKQESSFAAIAVNTTSISDGDGDGEFSGATSAGGKTRAIAVREAVRACRKGEPGRCKSVVSAKDGWAALVVTADQAGRLRVFGADAGSYDAAFDAATRRSTVGTGRRDERPDRAGQGGSQQASISSPGPGPRRVARIVAGGCKGGGLLPSSEVCVDSR